MNNSVTLFANGQRYDLPDSEVANFRKTAEASNIPVEDGQSFRTKDGDTYTIPSSQIEAFRAAAPDAESVRPFRFADNSTKYMTMPEMSKFLRSKEWREGDEYKADREERDRAVNAKMGEDGEMHSPAWAGVKGALKGAAQGAWEGGNAAANKIAKAIPEIGVSLESALGNALNLGGNAPNAVGNWFLANAASGKAWLDAKLPDQAKDWVGYEDWSTKTADKFADVSAMAYKFAPAMATGGSTSLVNTMFASDGINAASQTFDNAMQNGFTPGEANKAAAASFLVNFYGAKLMTRAGGVADNIANPLLRLAGGAAGVGTTMGVQNAANRGIENITSGRPFAEGMGEAFEEGNVEGLMFHGINAIPGAVIKTGDRMRESREAKEYRRDSLLEVARGEDGGEFLNALLSGEGLDAAVRARKSGADVSRKIGERAGLPDNMSAAERNEIIDAIAKARGERAAQNAVKVDGFRSEALDAAIGEVGGVGEVAQDIRARVLRKIENARELDDPFRREELVGEAFEEWDREHPKEKTNETRNGADEAPAQPKPPVETRAEGAEAVRPVEAEPPRGEAPRPDVVKPAEKPKEPPQGSQEPPAPPKTGEDTPATTEGAEPPSRASDATGGDAVSSYISGMKPLERSRVTKVLNRRGVYEDGKTAAESISALVGTDSEVRAQHNGKGGVDYIIGDTFGNKTEADFARHVGVKVNEESILRAQEEASLFKTMKKAEQVTRSRGFTGGDFSVPMSDKALQEQIDKLNSIGKYQPEANTRLKALEAVKAGRIKRGTWEGDEGISKTETTTPPAKPVPDGKGKMVKPKKEKTARREPQDVSALNEAIKEAKTVAKSGENKLFEVKVGTTTVKFLSNEKGIEHAEKMAKTLSTVKDWSPKYLESKTPSAPKPLKVAKGKNLAGFDDISKEYVSKGKNARTGLTKPIVKDGMVYATDGRSIIRMPAEGVADTKDAPDVAKVYPENRKGNPIEKFTFNPSESHVGLEQASALTSKDGTVEMWRSPTGEIMFRSRVADSAWEPSSTSSFVGSSLKDADLIGSFDPDYLSKSFQTLAKLGVKDAEVEWRGATSALYVKGGDAEILIMPKHSGKVDADTTVQLLGGKRRLTDAGRAAALEEEIKVEQERAKARDPEITQASLDQIAKRYRNNEAKALAKIKETDGKQDPLYSPSKPASDSKTIGDTIAELDRLIAEEESGAAPSGKAEGLPSRAENFAPGPGTKGFFSRLVSKNSIVRAIKDNFPEFAIRGKNTTNIGKNYAGHFEPWRELIRSKDMSSIDTVPHEIGHGISMIAKRKMMNIPQEVKRELAKWGRDLYGNKRPAAGYMEEGFAEYVRGYMTGAEDLATQAPHLDAWFRNNFAKKNPDFVRRMDRVRAEVMRWRMQNDVQKVAAMQNPETSAARRAWDKVKSVFTQEAWNDEGATLTKGYKKSGLDSLHEWREDFRQLEKLAKSGQGGSQAAKDLAAEINRKILSDPRIFASNARGTSKARVLDMAKYGVTNLTGTEKIGDVTGFDANGKPIRNNNTESYRDIFGDFTKKELADFDVYAAAKVGLENYVKKGREFGMDKATLERVVSKLESPRFLNALERFTAFSRRALSVGLEAGALTPKQYQKIVGEHKYYVRTERRLAEDGAGTGGRQQNPIKAIKGSTRNIVPPRTATLMQIEKQLRYFQTMKTLNMIARDVLQAEKANEAFFKNGTGRDYKIGANLPVKVPNAKESVKFKSDKLRKQVVDALNSAGAQGAGGETGDALFDQLFADGDAPLTVFRERPSDGRHGLVSTYIDGKLVTFELPDAAWEKYITGMEKGNGGFDNKVGDALWNVATATPKLLRLGATTLNPVFATANFMRDTFHAAIMSESGALPLVSSVSGMMNDVLGKDAGRLFRSMGGEMAMLMGANPEAQAKHVSEVALAKGLLGNIEANTTLLSPLSGVSRVIADILSKPEMGPRVREVMGVMKRAQAAGLDREASAWLAFAAGKDISIDFGKHGYLMKRLNQLIPYTNAWYRGLEQFVRKLGMTNALPTQFEERRSVNLAKTATRALVTLSSVAVVNSIASLLLMDERERRAQFNKTPREKWEYDDILGIVRVPLPFELGAVFYAIPKAMVYEAFGDKGAVKEAIWHGLSTNVGKYSSVQDFLSGITLIAPFVDNLRNAKWDGAPVVAPHIKDAYAKDPQMWYDHSTTEIAKWAGEKLDWAPAHIDHVANTWTGGMWKRFLSPASDTTLMTATGLSAFRPRPTARRDVRDFYEFRSEAQSHYNAGTASLEDIGRLRRANKLHEEIAPLFKEARELGSSGLSQSERNKRREEIMDEVFDKIHEWRVAETDDRKGGIAKAADALTSSVEISEDVRSRNLAALKGVSYEEAAAALKAYGREKMQTPVRNSRGFKTGRMKTHPRWTNETIQKRLRILRRIMNENGD